MSTIIRNTQGSSREWCLSKNANVYSAVVNNGPGPAEVSRPVPKCRHIFKMKSMSYKLKHQCLP